MAALPSQQAGVPADTRKGANATGHTERFRPSEAAAGLRNFAYDRWSFG